MASLVALKFINQCFRMSDYQSGVSINQRSINIIILILSVVGLASSIYLTYLHQQIFTGKLEDFGFCGISRSISCEAVSASPYSKMFGVPLSWLGTLLYLFWIALAAIAAFKPENNIRISNGLILVTSAAAVAANIYLGQLMFFTLDTVCPLCLLTYAVNLLVLILALHLAKGFRLASASEGIRAMIPFSGQTRFGFVLVFVLIAAVGAIGQFQMQKGIEAASKFDKAGFQKFQESPRHEVDTASDPFHGGEGAKLTIVEFSDFQCLHCRKAYVVLQTVLPGYGDQVKLVFKNMPLSMHHSAKALARLSEVAHKQGKFWPLHDLIFERQAEFKDTPLDKNALMELAKDASLDMARVEKDYEGSAAEKAVKADRKEAERLKIRSTPVLLFNGLLIRGVPPPAVLKRIIELELERVSASK
ncbi:MAG: vitamin K epoxide reductase family protein [Sedimenticola sp.]